MRSLQWDRRKHGQRELGGTLLPQVGVTGFLFGGLESQRTYHQPVRHQGTTAQSQTPNWFSAQKASWVSHQPRQLLKALCHPGMPPHSSQGLFLSEQQWTPLLLPMGEHLALSIWLLP